MLEDYYSDLSYFQAIDPDAGDYGVVHYQLSGVDQDDENLPFYLSPDNLLEATREFNYNDKRQFVFSVTAYDSQLDTTVQRRTTVPVYVSTGKPNF